MRLRWQLALTLAALAAAAALAASLAAYNSTSRELSAETNTFLAERLTEIADFGEFFGSGGPTFGPFGRDDDSPGFGGPAFPFVRPDADTVYLNSDGTQRASLATVDIAVSADERAVAATGSGRVLRDVQVDDRSYRVLTAPLDPGDPTAGAVQIARDTTQTSDLLAELRWQLLLITAAVTAAAATIGWALARRLAKPLEQLRSAAANVATTKTFHTQLPVTTQGEVAEVTASFNTMLVELDQSRRQQHQLVQDANHELRTPLATLSANLELLQSLPSDSPERADILAEARTELAELTTLTEQLTSIASQQYNQTTRTQVDLQNLAVNAADQLKIKTSRPIEITSHNPTLVSAAPDVLTRAVANLLANADKYAPPDTPIEITITGPTLTIRDHGPGIVHTDLPHLFDPFYRADAARTQPGSGLGLAIAKQIIDDHHGTITATNHPTGGAQFTISLMAREPVRHLE